LKEHDIDTERLAALLDGRVGDAERAELLERLAASDDDFQTFAETAAVLRESEEADAPAPVSSGRVRATAAPRPPSTHAARGWRRRPARWAALAAVVCLALSAALFAALRSRGSTTPEAMAYLLSDPGMGLPGGWGERRPWGGALGAGTPLTPAARAVRSGALHTDLSVAVGARQAAETSRLTGEIAALVADVPGAAPVVEEYREVGRGAGGAPERLAEPLERAGAGAAEFLGRDFVALGAWTEAARIAAARRDAEFFRTPESRGVLERAGEIPDLPHPALSQIERVRAAAAGPDWPVLAESLDGLLGTLAR
jgi:hypothetical protein